MCALNLDDPLSESHSAPSKDGNQASVPAQQVMHPSKGCWKTLSMFSYSVALSLLVPLKFPGLQARPVLLCFVLGVPVEDDTDVFSPAVSSVMWFSSGSRSGGSRATS